MVLIRSSSFINQGGLLFRKFNIFYPLLLHFVQFNAQKALCKNTVHGELISYILKLRSLSENETHVYARTMNSKIGLLEWWIYCCKCVCQTCGFGCYFCVLENITNGTSQIPSVNLHLLVCIQHASEIPFCSTVLTFPKMVGPSVCCSGSPGEDTLSILSDRRRAMCSLWTIPVPKTREWRLNSELSSCCRLFSQSVHILSLRDPVKVWTYPVSGSLSSSGCLGMTINQIHLGNLRMGDSYWTESNLCQQLVSSTSNTFTDICMYLKTEE